MAGSPAPETSFAARLKAGERLIGTFIKIPSVHATEVLGALGFDFVVIDQEHAPLDLTQIDTLILAARASGMAALVRISDPAPANILSLLDCGAAGILAPHVDGAEKAAAIASACRYRGGTRGFSRTGRAGGYGSAAVEEHVARQDADVLCIAMIEDPQAIPVIDEIVAVTGIDAVFVGRGDLSVAMGETKMSAPPVLEASAKVGAATRAAGKPLLMLAENPADQVAMAALGATSFLVGSDLGFLRKAASQALAAHTKDI